MTAGDLRAVPAGDFDYEVGGQGYAVRRQTDPRIAALVQAELGDARSILNVGAGAGSYEPRDRCVTAGAVERGVARLREALASGQWDARHGHLRSQPERIGAVRLVVAR